MDICVYVCVLKYFKFKEMQCVRAYVFMCMCFYHLWYEECVCNVCVCAVERFFFSPFLAFYGIGTRIDKTANFESEDISFLKIFLFKIVHFIISHVFLFQFFFSSSFSFVTILLVLLFFFCFLLLFSQFASHQCIKLSILFFVK